MPKLLTVYGIVLVSFASFCWSADKYLKFLSLEKSNFLKSFFLAPVIALFCANSITSTGELELCSICVRRVELSPNCVDTLTLFFLAYGSSTSERICLVAKPKVETVSLPLPALDEQAEVAKVVPAMIKLAANKQAFLNFITKPF